MRVSQPGRDADLTQEALDPEDRSELGMEHLDGNRAAVFAVFRQEHRRHSSAADRAIDRVAVLEAFMQASEEGGQTSLPTPRLRDSAASARPGILPRSP